MVILIIALELQFSFGSFSFNLLSVVEFLFPDFNINIYYHDREFNETFHSKYSLFAVTNLHLYTFHRLNQKNPISYYIVSLLLLFLLLLLSLLFLSL